MADELAVNGSLSDSTASTVEEEKEGGEVSKCEKQDDMPAKLDLGLGKRAAAALSTSSLDSSASESLLEELLGDIRRSHTASLASTPTFVSSDYETDGVRDCGRSEAELRAMGEVQLQAVLDNLEHEVDTVSQLLVRLLHVRDKRAGRLVAQYDKLTTVLRHFAKKNGMPGHANLKFSLHHPESPEQHCQWRAAWTVLSQLPKGIPKHWRKTLWSCLAEYGMRTVDWPSQFHSLFSEYSTPEDDLLGTQIVKDLHRTGNAGFNSEEEHAILKRVLLAYARYNKTTGYCQGFNILTALILKVVDFDETMALMILVYLVDHKLPENYFSHTLYALSGDMAVFRHLLKVYLPELSLHMETLQKEASGTVKKSYSSDNPPDMQSVYAYEPPLADVFSMQWFLTIFATTLPRKACRRVWDAIFLEGSEYMQYTAVAILAVMERDLLHTETAADFYSAMATLSNQLRKTHIMSSAEFMQVVYAVKGCTLNSETPVPAIRELREKYTYNIYPCGLQSSGEIGTAGGKGTTTRPMAPLPSRGGSFATDESWKRAVRNNRQQKVKEPRSSECGSKRLQRAFGGGENAAISGPVDQQIKYLNKHYDTVAKQPTHVRCDMQVTPPIARAYCPQQQRDTNPIPYYTAYAADVPLDVIQQSRVMSGFDQLLKLHEHRRHKFMLSFSESPDSHNPLLARGGWREGGGGEGARELIHH